MLRVGFAGTPEFAVPCLDALAAADVAIPVVYTQPDRASGRGRKRLGGAIKTRAQALGLHTEQPDSLTDVDTTCADHSLDLLVVVAYGLLIPEKLLAVPAHGCVNVHASLLPRWRGAAPVARAIEAGDSTTGVSLMQMDRGLDTGGVLAQATEAIHRTDTAATLERRLAHLGAQMLQQLIVSAQRGEWPIPQPQDSGSAVYAAKLDKQEGLIDWSAKAIELDRRVRAFNPWPIAYTYHHGTRLRIWEAEVQSTRNQVAPGTVLSADSTGIVVQAGADALRVVTVQRPGGKTLAVADLLRGYRIATADRMTSK
ncbi:MAG: methionyl-tRNA formyltransferase [Gammaproteobacteria bacterium]|nr:methionyl-tRNA formyltransferase [Gammaproteobacteria bacterium]